jgi:misacylated tRNA(Ala) deacylase
LLASVLYLPPDHIHGALVTHGFPLGDPLLRYLETTVVSATVSQPAPQPARKSGKKSVLAPELPKDPILEIILHDTVIFPEGGGQPTDTGVIKTLQDGLMWEVIQAKRHGGHAVHYVRVKDGNVDAAIASFSNGAQVEAQLDQKGWDRRYDHVRRH